MATFHNLERPYMILVLVTTSLWVLLQGLSALAAGTGGQIGVDYGLNGDNLLSSKQTVALLRSKGISRVRMYDAKQEITKAFANSGIDLMLGIPNELVPKIAGNLAEAINWVTQNVAQFPNSGISAVIVGNEWLLDPSHDPSLLLPAMLNIYTVLTTTQLLNLDLSGVKVSTSHALNVLGISFPPSAAAFDGGLLSILSPVLEFLEKTGSFFMVNIFPYFAYVEDENVSLEFALFEAKQPVQDPNTKLNYTNLFDLQLDAVYAALEGASGSNNNSVVLSSRGSKAVSEVGIRGTSRARTQYYYFDKAGRRRGRPRVLVGESGWPSGSGASGSVPHQALLPSSTRSHDISPNDDLAITTSLLSSSPDVINCKSSSSRDSNNPAAANSAMSDPSTCSLSRGSQRRDVISHRQPAARAGGIAEAGGGAGNTGGSNSTCGAEGARAARVCMAASLENARTYNQNLIRHVLQAKGTPANPTTPIQAYIFELFDEDLKPPGPEQHYGLFFPNGTPVYSINFH